MGRAFRDQLRELNCCAVEQNGVHHRGDQSKRRWWCRYRAMLDRPIIGGRYLFQCKRFAADNLIGSPTVREFYRAPWWLTGRPSKEILITTSGFHAASS